MTEVKNESKNRSRRIRKKMRVDEFQELGFDAAWQFAEGTTDAEIDTFMDKFFAETIETQGLGFGGEGDLIWHGLICTQKLGKCTDENRKAVEKWLNDAGAKSVVVSELYDVWWA